MNNHSTSNNILPDTIVLAEYIWLDAFNSLRGKTKVLNYCPKSVHDLPLWNFDGSSTGQATGKNSEVWLKPQRIFRDPFRRGKNILVLCDCYTPDMKPLPSNTRFTANVIFEKTKDLEPMFGLEQEYVLFDKNHKHPYGWPKDGFPGPQGPYYCSVGSCNAFGREIVETHLKYCLYAGVKISGINGEVMPSQWEFQVGPCIGIEAGDHLWIARYILQRLGEMFNISISFDPKPMKGDWNGSGCHTNFSTKAMRSDGGIKYIYEAIEKLAKKHDEHVAVYGKGNHRRLTGNHETCSIKSFKYGVGDRSASVRIPTQTEKEGKGYFEDRRPASNSDPWVVTSLLVETCCCWAPK